jgi:hypothetical protein
MGLFKRRDAGNAALNVLFVIAILLLVLGGGMTLVSAGRNYGARLVRHEEKQKAALDILSSIQTDLEMLLKDDEADGPQSKGVTALEALYSEYALRIMDVSSGINEHFLPEALLKKDALKNLIMQKSKEDITRYGWMHILFLPEKTKPETDRLFSKDETDNLFPLINSFPVVNIHFLSENCLRAFAAAFSIEKGDERSADLFARSRQTLLRDTDIESILKVKKDNPILAFLGCKTSFWQIVYKTNDCTVTAVFAAVPDKKENPRKVERYMLVERSVRFE